MKLTQLIQQGAAQLDQAKVAFGHGTLNAHDEATWLILWQLQMPLDTEVANETTVDASQVAACQNLIQQRIAEFRVVEQDTDSYADAQCFLGVTCIVCRGRVSDEVQLTPQLLDQFGGRFLHH